MRGIKDDSGTRRFSEELPGGISVEDVPGDISSEGGRD